MVSHVLVAEADFEALAMMSQTVVAVVSVVRQTGLSGVADSIAMSARVLGGISLG